MADGRIRPRRSRWPELEEVRGGAPKRAPNVRVLAGFSDHADCALAALGFAAHVDFDHLLTGTPYEAPFGMSPFAFARGQAFERSLSEGGYGPVLSLLRERMGFDITDARVVNLRGVYPQNREGMRLRAHETRSLLREIVHRDPHAPNLIDGAVLETEIGGISAHFEADSLAARFGGEIHTGEVKSFPVVDGRTEPDKLGSALDQAAIYTLLTARTVDAAGGDPSIVSPKALLITPRNVGLRPTLSVIDVSRRMERTEQLLSRTPDIRELARELPPGTSFGPVADQTSELGRRIEALHGLADQVGTHYVSSCVTGCGLYRFCRGRARGCGSPGLIGEKGTRLLPGVASLDRAAELAAGAPASEIEQPVAQQLSLAARLHERARQQGGRA
jgi:hypothetical protein